MQEARKHPLSFSILFLPPTFWLVFFFTVPLAIVWVYSFGSRGPLGETLLGFSLHNYARVFDEVNLYIFVKSLWMAGIATFVCLVVGFALAMGICFAPPKYRNLLLLLVILPFWTNLLIRTYAWIAVLRTKGYVNFALEWVHDLFGSAAGLVGYDIGKFQPLELLYNNNAVIVGLIYVGLPFMVLPLYSTLEKLDKSYLEASLDLGAGQWRTLFSVTIPLVLPGLVTGLLLTFILSLGNYLTPDLLGGTDSIMIANLIAKQFGPSRDWPFGAALSFMLMYPIFLALWARPFIEKRRAAMGARP